jgi:hypothetical protein
MSLAPGMPPPKWLELELGTRHARSPHTPQRLAATAASLGGGVCACADTALLFRNLVGIKLTPTSRVCACADTALLFPHR